MEDICGYYLSQSSMQRAPVNYPYDSSIASSASSSTSSVFSSDCVSSQYSVSSTSSSLGDVSWDNPITRVNSKSWPASDPRNPVVPLDQRKNPRRTGNCGDATSNASRAPPPLVRQSERRVNFVDNLVDSTTSLVESIWPLAGCPPRSESTPCGKGILPLRTFIQETLRRSRTSYSTLQVALYYLVLIKPYLPKRDFTMEQTKSSGCSRAMQCGRRMFLAALILASKYLQDRNYSARAWSKISGLNTCEINTNELTFLNAVGWKLHISEAVFQKWTDIVLRFTPNDNSSTVFCPSESRTGNCWASIISRLTPELDHIDLDNLETGAANGAESAYPSPPSSDARTPSPRLYDAHDSPVISPPREQTPANATNLPRVFEPPPRSSGLSDPSMPPVPRQAMLPTPQMTPQSSAVNTPAVSVGGFGSRRPSICSAMAQVQNACMQRTTFERCPPPTFCKPAPVDTYPGIRRSSLAQSTSSASSPESMVSDISTRSSRSSRSSSISSIASAACAPAQSARLAAAPRRCAMPCAKENLQNVTIAEQEPLEPVGYADAYLSPEAYSGPVPDVSGMSINTPTQTTPAMAEAAQGLCQLSGGAIIRREREDTSPVQSRKRLCPNSNMSLQDNVRELLSTQDGDDCNSVMDELRSTVADPYPSTSSSTKFLALSRPSSSTGSSPSERTPVPPPCKGARKRTRCAPDAAAKMLRKTLSLQSPVA